MQQCDALFERILDVLYEEDQGEAYQIVGQVIADWKDGLG